MASKNFKYLDDLIHGGAKEIVLDSDIVLDDGEESKDLYFRGVILDLDDLVIDGNGHTIDGKEKARIFSCRGKDIIIKNFILKNAVGSAIDNCGKLSIFDSKFINNLGYGGAIFNRGGGLAVINSEFTNNSAMRLGGAINNRGILNIVNSFFIKNDAYHAGGAIYNNGELNIKESIFINNDAPRTGGAICNIGVLNIEHSSFSDNISFGNGDAIFNNGKFNIKEGTFKNNEIYDCYKDK